MTPADNAEMQAADTVTPLTASAAQPATPTCRPTMQELRASLQDQALQLMWDKLMAPQEVQ